MRSTYRHPYVFFAVLLSCLGFSRPAFSEDMTRDTVSAQYVRDRLHYGHLTNYLEQHNPYTIYQGVYQGQWTDSDPLIFSVNGNSWRWNRYYIDGMRVDDRYHAGSTLYRPNMERHSLNLNYRTSQLYFESDTTVRDFVSWTGNWGSLGGINPSTAAIIHVFHGTGTEGAYDKQTIQNRQHTAAAGTIESQFTLHDKTGRPLRQHFYATIGERRLPNYDANGLLPTAPTYGAGYGTVQLYGDLPSLTSWLSSAGYRLHYSNQGSSGSEHYLNPNEVGRLHTFSASLYGKRKGLTLGVTYSLNAFKHHNLRFDRNIADQDGESLFPWSPDGRTHEISLFADYRRQLLPWLQLHVEAYNSILHHQPTTEQWSNLVYEQHALQPERQPLYLIQWQSSPFNGALLENTAGLEAEKKLGRWGTLHASADLTLDGMVLNDKTHIMPHGQAAVGLDIHPCRWFRMSVNVGYDRVPYTIEQLRYMSNDYLNGSVRFFHSGREFTTTGGAYHQYASNSMSQPSYLTLDFPIRFTFGRHEIALLQTYRKYCNTWMTTYANPNRTFTTPDGISYLQPGICQYVVGYQPHSLMGDSWLFNTPYHISQLTAYTYRGKKVTFGLSWQSLITAGPSALGIGPSGNDIGVLSESTANPNTHLVQNNPVGKYAGVGRLDQDKGYVARMYLSYNVCRYLQLGGTFKWTDGQPFSTMHTYSLTDALGNTQVAIVPSCSRGTNPTDGDFGCRESAIFNIDLHARAHFWAKGHHVTLDAYCYNVYDFGNVLMESMFPQGFEVGYRGPNLSLTIPRGFLCTLKVEL